MSLPRSPAVARNREPIVAVLAGEFADARSVLEIGSGTGEHAVYFAPRMDWLTWQPSDRADNLPGINAWLEHAPADNLAPAIELDVNRPPAIEQSYDGVYSANTAHIMSIGEVERMFGLVGRVLAPGGRFCLYGPFNRGGRFTSDSNEAFDRSLRLQDPAMGIRDLEELDEFGRGIGAERVRLHEMPANNFIAVWKR
jgi:SAM-dependent methyltransferase